jgi:hypothetical protein
MFKSYYFREVRHNSWYQFVNLMLYFPHTLIKELQPRHNNDEVNRREGILLLFLELFSKYFLLIQGLHILLARVRKYFFFYQLFKELH